VSHVERELPSFDVHLMYKRLLVHSPTRLRAPYDTPPPLLVIFSPINMC
jgi:hypothetical protein